MSSILELHRQAMEFADTAFIARHQGDYERAKEFYSKALEKEQNAAKMLLYSEDAEPTRSVLFRSAASMAMNCGELREAERLIAIALTGNPPEEIAEELRNLLEQVYFSRHLELRGVVLDPTEFQLSIAGKAVGYDMAESSEFIDRINSTKVMIQRTAQRVKNLPYKDRVSKAIREAFEVFVTVPRPASFAVTFKVGSLQQTNLPDIGLPVDVIDELMVCLDLYNKSETQELQNHIKDEAYYNNFIGLVGRISPDGDDVKQVGFTSLRGGQTKTVALKKPQEQFQTIGDSTKISMSKTKGSKQPVTLIGQLRFANSLSQNKTRTIKLEDAEGKAHSIIVPEGMMSDIVKPLWESIVEITGTPYRRSIRLEKIREVE